MGINRRFRRAVERAGNGRVSVAHVYKSEPIIESSPGQYQLSRIVSVQHAEEPEGNFVLVAVFDVVPHQVGILQAGDLPG